MPTEGVFPLSVSPGLRKLDRLPRVMRTEVKDFMRMCERLMGLALQTGELSAEECDILSYYAKELHQTTHPLCEKHRCNTSVSSS